MKDQSVHESADENNGISNTILLEKTISTGVLSLPLGFAVVLVMTSGDALMGIPLHWTLKTIVGVAFLMNLAAFVINVGIFLRRKKKSSESERRAANYSSWENSQSGREGERYMDDPEIRKLMDKVSKKGR